MKAVLEAARSASPYLLAEVLLPGGTLIALIMWTVRNRSELRAHGRRLLGQFSGPA
jgi:hypothetical protein